MLHNIKRIYITICLCITLIVAGQSQNQHSISDTRKAYLDHLELLFEEGRHYYVEIGNKSQLLRIIESYNEAIDQGSNDGILDQKSIDSLLLFAQKNKLLGDYHYLNSDDDPKSYALSEKYFMEALSYTQSSTTKNSLFPVCTSRRIRTTLLQARAL